METILDRIHRSSIELLASVGVHFHCPEILEQLAVMGVGVAGDLVRFTEAQVMDCLSMAPEAFTLKAGNMELGCILSGDENTFKRSPRILLLINTLRPLQMDAQALATLKVCAEYRQALLITPGVMFGTTSPITTVGSVIQANAEFLAACCTAQLLSPGLPVVYGCLGAPADIRTGGLLLDSPARFTFADLATGLAERYHLPNRGIGSVTDAGQVSVQSGYEAMFTLINDYQRRASLSFHAAGVLASFSAFSYEQFIIDLEMIRMVTRSIEASTFNDGDFALDVIRETGPGGQYISKKHTLPTAAPFPFYRN